jgi:MATE family multidrug resistance protein
MHNIDPLLAEKAVGYLRALLWGAPGYLFFQVARNQCEGLAKTKPGMVMGFIGLLVNIPVNYIFIYGHFGMPELGGVGCGVATASVYWVMFASMLWWVRRRVRCAISAAQSASAARFRRHVTAGAAGAAHCSGAVL